MGDESTEKEKAPTQDNTESSQELHSSESMHQEVESHTDSDHPGKEPVTETGSGKKAGPHHTLWQWIQSHKAISIISGVVLLLALIAAIPATRYAVAGLFWKQNFPVQVTDASTGKPVTFATVELKGKKTYTDNKGLATIKVPVGNGTLAISKQYYQSSSKKVLVPIMKPKQPYAVTPVATGRQVPVTITNKITGKPVENATITASAEKSAAKTDAKGQAVLVLPADKTDVTAAVTAAGYNTLQPITIKITTQADPTNTFAITPAGTVYFLSNKSGTIDVVSTSLDGQNRQTILAGTGKEDDSDTALLVTRDWKYLLLKAKRDSDKPKLYLIDTAQNNKLSVVDEGDANFSLIGWYNHYFLFDVERNTVPYYQPKHSAIKSFNADAKSLATLDESDAGPVGSQYTYQTFGSFYTTDAGLVYTAQWFPKNGTLLSGKTDAIKGVRPDGQNKQDYKTFDSTQTAPIDGRPYKPNEIYYRIYDQNYSHPTFYELDDSTFEPTTDIDNAKFDKPYPTYLLSPSGKQTFWNELRDGKNAFFVGNSDGDNGKQVAALDESQVFGWYGEDYLLVSKKGSELYVLPVTGSDQPLKVSDYYKPPVNYYGYGRGYGGQ